MRNSIFAVAAAMMVLSGAALAEAPQVKDYGDYQIVRANDSTVWRLNKRTGEMTVCRLVRDAMVCTSSTTAAKAPAKTYEQLEAEQKAAEAARKDKQIATMDRFLGVFRDLFATAIDSGGAAKPGDEKKSEKP